jgi:6-pyruvoyl-tetrahydropterin synthase
MDIGDVTQAVQEITRRLDEEELHQDFEDWMLEQDTGKEYEEDLLP